MQCNIQMLICYQHYASIVMINRFYMTKKNSNAFLVKNIKMKYLIKCIAFFIACNNNIG